MGYIALPSVVNAIIGITSYSCVILQMVVLHDALKTIQNVFFVFFLKKITKTYFFFGKPKKRSLKKNKKHKVDCFFEKKGFFATLIPAIGNFN